ncbi:MAG TPA: BON domain-containing protein [Candidatus Binatia bacterium]|nr:BON domain-containing protein [Candidatus Binatia bacterium]
MASAVDAVVARLRQMLVGNHSQVTERLERELDELRRTLRDPLALRALVIEALHDESLADPATVAEALGPALQHWGHEHPRTPPRLPGARARSWLPLIVVVAVGAAAAGWRGHGSVVRAATEQVTHPQSVQQLHDVVPMIEERHDGFGLGNASRSDAELVGEVRTRLSGCRDLVGARLSFSVTNGWVWLRGESSGRAREAATRALADLGDDVMVVNQLIVSDAGPSPTGVN